MCDGCKESSSSGESSTKIDTNPRFDWYQTDSQVVLTIFVKKIIPQSSTVAVTEDSVKVKLDTELETRVERTFNLERNVKKETSSYKILSTKLEIKLVKSEGAQWTKLERAEDKPSTSSKTARNWDKLVDELDDKGEENDLANLFQKIYEDGSDEVKKAMNKSFFESGGTELNTNWSAVGKDKVSIKPPEGLEWKEWDK